MSTKLGNLIKNGRDGVQLTQDELAIKLNATQQTISRWEAGKIMPPMERLPALAAAIQIPLDELLAAGAESAVAMKQAGIEPEPTRMEAFDSRLSRIEELLAQLAESSPAMKRRATPLQAVKKQAPGRARRQP